MNKPLRFSTLAMILLALLSTPLQAAPGGGHGGGGYGGHGGGYRAGHGGHYGHGGWGWGGFALGAALTWPYYYGASYYAPYYANPTYVVAPYAAPTNLVSQPAATPAPSSSSSWYYCNSSQAYYPYVKTCKEGWQAVPSVPPDL